MEESLNQVNKPSFGVATTTWCAPNTLVQPSREQRLQGVKVKRDYNPGTRTNAGSRPTIISRIAAASSSFYLDEEPSLEGRCSAFEDPHRYLSIARSCFRKLLSFFFLQTNSDRLAPQVYRIYQKLLLSETDGNKTGFSFEEVPLI